MLPEWPTKWQNDKKRKKTHKSIAVLKRCILPKKEKTKAKLLSKLEMELNRLFTKTQNRTVTNIIKKSELLKPCVLK